MCILSILTLDILCPHYFGIPIDPHDFTVVASALRCPWRSALSCARWWCCVAYEERLSLRTRVMLEFRVDLCRAARASPSCIAAEFGSLFGMSDAEINALARLIVAAVGYYPSGPELITFLLNEFYNRRYLS